MSSSLTVYAPNKNHGFHLRRMRHIMMVLRFYVFVEFYGATLSKGATWRDYVIIQNELNTFMLQIEFVHCHSRVLHCPAQSARFCYAQHDSTQSNRWDLKNRTDFSVQLHSMLFVGLVALAIWQFFSVNAEVTTFANVQVPWETEASWADLKCPEQIWTFLTPFTLSIQANDRVSMYKCTFDSPLRSRSNQHICRSDLKRRFYSTFSSVYWSTVSAVGYSLQHRGIKWTHCGNASGQTNQNH